LRFVRTRLEHARSELPRGYELALRLMLRQVELLWDRGMLDYILLHGTKPDVEPNID
jgi:hypothetical protein